MKVFEIFQRYVISKRDRLIAEAVESDDLDSVVNLLSSENPDLFVKYNDRLIRMAAKAAIKNEKFTDFDSIMNKVVSSLTKTVTTQRKNK